MSDLMADLRAAADDATARGHDAVKLHMETRDLTKLLALLDAGKACRDELGAPCDDAECGETPCVLVRAYDEAAK